MKKERGRNTSVWLPLTHPLTGDLACNPGMCPDWELNWQPFGSYAGAPSIEPQQPGFWLPLIRIYVIAFRAHPDNPG